MSRATLVDSNVLLDVIAEGSAWREWSERVLAETGTVATLVINPIIYAEVSAGFNTPAEVDAAVPRSVFRRDPLPWEAGFLAGQCFVRYRRLGGTRRSPLPDFYIGAHAMVSGMTLLTRDARRYRTYFPKLKLIAPDP